MVDPDLLRGAGEPVDNFGDTQEGLHDILETSFEQVELETLGSMAVFAATKPRTNPPTGETP